MVISSSAVVELWLGDIVAWSKAIFWEFSSNSSVWASAFEKKPVKKEITPAFAETGTDKHIKIITEKTPLVSNLLMFTADLSDPTGLHFENDLPPVLLRPDPNRGSCCELIIS